jgi:hypothetical protein
MKSDETEPCPGAMDDLAACLIQMGQRGAVPWSGRGDSRNDARHQMKAAPKKEMHEEKSN